MPRMVLVTYLALSELGFYQVSCLGRVVHSFFLAFTLAWHGVGPPLGAECRQDQPSFCLHTVDSLVTEQKLPSTETATRPF